MSVTIRESISYSGIDRQIKYSEVVNVNQMTEKKVVNKFSEI